MRNALSKPGILIALFKVGTAAASLGFLQTTLEPHLHDLKPPLSSFQVGALFMVVGGTYGLSLPLWGYLCDSQMTRNSPKFVEVLGAILIGSGFLVLGKIEQYERQIGLNIEVMTHDKSRSLHRHISFHLLSIIYLF